VNEVRFEPLRISEMSFASDTLVNLVETNRGLWCFYWHRPNVFHATPNRSGPTDTPHRGFRQMSVVGIAVNMPGETVLIGESQIAVATCAN
jgi:hypothetical protein